MKKLIFSGIMVLSLAMIMVSCANDGATTADAKVTTATPATPAPATPTPAATPAAPVGPTTILEFAESTFDFGSVDEGEKVSHTYSFTNTGKEPLIISNAKGSCGCTVPVWPKEPIAPGGKGEVTVEFNSKGKKGKRNQKVTLTSNTDPAQTFIYLTGEVIPDPNAPKPAAPAAGTPQVKVN